jgi:hypothetical protein
MLNGYMGAVPVKYVMPSFGNGYNMEDYVSVVRYYEANFTF